MTSASDGRDSDGSMRRERGGKRRARFQVIREHGRVVGYRKQVTDPVTGERRDLRHVDEDGINALITTHRRIAADHDAGIITSTEAIERLGALHRGRPLRLSDAWAPYVETLGRGSRKTAKSLWEHRIAPKLGNLAVAEMSSGVLAQWQAWARLEVGPKTVCNAYGFFAAAVTRSIGDLRALPWGKWRPEPPDEDATRWAALSKDQLAAIVEIARRTVDTSSRFPDLPMRIGVLILLGLRQSEGAALRAFGDGGFFLNNGKLHVHPRYAIKDGWKTEFPAWDAPKEAPKGKKAYRLIEADEQLTALWLEQVDLLRDAGLFRAGAPLFPGKEAAPGTSIRDWWRCRKLVTPDIVRTVARKAGVPVDALRISTHSLRASFATHAFAATGDIKQVQLAMNHHDVEQTLKYVRSLQHEHRPPSIAIAGMARATMLGGVASRPELPAASMVVRESPEVFVSELPTPPPEAEPDRDATREHHERHLGRKVADFAAMHARWVAAGRPDETPPEVLEAAQAHARRASTEATRAARRAGLGEEEALAAGRKAYAKRRAQTLGAWGLTKSREAKKEAARRGAGQS